MLASLSFILCHMFKEDFETMNHDIGRPISRQAFGRTAFLGSFYDATTDEFCESSIVNDEIPTVTIRHLNENHDPSSFKFDISV
ncbi:unnamed protein product [Rotaria sp. Silwood2]|nr:unnamed protein product [Rotaria sp. Silwood2]CAF2991348.1 unnamed protein product [Rotaria sp. Silwood2]CAF3962659.1 unnamed protein product [Rotaria sp. Silwood2]CAF4013520.1 unnamed protein product [Rotaria sp. Silwood2]